MLTPKQQALLDSITKAVTGGAKRVEIPQSELQTAKTLKLMGLIVLTRIDFTYEATLVDPVKVVVDIDFLISVLQLGCKVLMEGSDPDGCRHVQDLLYNEKGHIDELHRALRDKEFKLNQKD
jgi:hypothetical protein